MFENKVLTQKGQKSGRPDKCNNILETSLSHHLSFSPISAFAYN